MSQRPIEFTEIQILNFLCLQTVGICLIKDRISAMYRFQLSAEQAERLARLDPGHLHRLVSSLEHVSLFAPRSDIVRLLDVPPALVPVLATAAPFHAGTLPDVEVDRRRKADRRRGAGKLAA